MHILAISGSLRRDSHNTALLRAAEELLEPGNTLELWDELREVPPFDQDLDEGPAPAAVASLRAAVARADAVLIATPEYNHSVPGVLKNALDWAPRPHASNVFRGKPAAVIGSSTGLFGAVWAQAELRKVLGAMGARVVEIELPVGLAAEKFDVDGRLVDEATRESLGGVLGALAVELRAGADRGLSFPVRALRDRPAKDRPCTARRIVARRQPSGRHVTHPPQNHDRHVTVAWIELTLRAEGVRPHPKGGGARGG